MAESSPTGKLSTADLLKSGIMAVLSAVLTFLQQVLFTASGEIQKINWKAVGGVAAAAAISYLLKNVLTNSSGEFLNVKATGPEA
jgi:uncharacterized membrane-anchored protein